MITRKWDEVEAMKTPHKVDARNMYNTSDAMVTVLTLQPGEALKRHITPADVVFYVLSGEGVVEVGDEKQTVSAATLIESPRDILHCWQNEGSEPLQVMVIKAPRPTEKSIFLEK